MSSDLWPAPVDHDHPKARVPQEHDIRGERLAQRRVAHRMAAIFDHDGGTVETRQPGQRLDQHRGLGQCGMPPGQCRGPIRRRCSGHVEYAEFSWT